MSEQKPATKKKVKRPYVMMSKVVLFHKCPTLKKLESEKVKRHRHRYDIDSYFIHPLIPCKRCRCGKRKP